MTTRVSNSSAKFYAVSICEQIESLLPWLISVTTLKHVIDKTKCDNYSSLQKKKISYMKKWVKINKNEFF